MPLAYRMCNSFMQRTSHSFLSIFTAHQLSPCFSSSFRLTGTLTVEEVYKDRDQFAALVREVAAPDVGRMGIEILSFTIKDVYDDVQYLQSLGKAQTASVKRDADAGVAEANRDAGIREAECEKSAWDVKYSTDTKIEDNSRMYQLQKANFDQEINTAVSCIKSIKLVATHGQLMQLTLPHATESRVAISVRTAGGQDSTEDQKRGDPNQCSRTKETNRD